MSSLSTQHAAAANAFNGQTVEPHLHAFGMPSYLPVTGLGSWWSSVHISTNHSLCMTDHCLCSTKACCFLPTSGGSSGLALLCKTRRMAWRPSCRSRTQCLWMAEWQPLCLAITALTECLRPVCTISVRSPEDCFVMLCSESKEKCVAVAGQPIVISCTAHRAPEWTD